MPSYQNLDLIRGALLDCQIINSVVGCEDMEHCIEPG
jgi:hypothetical protein